MKNMSICILLLASFESLLSQGYYPLQKGNIWQYRSADLMDPSYFEIKIIGDTTMPNKVTYRTFNGGSGFGSNYLRQENSKVYAYERTDSTEYLLLDFSANINDTMCFRNNGNSAIVLKAKYRDTTAHRNLWLFIDAVGTSSFRYDFADWMVEDSVGLVNIIGEPGMTWHMTGAIIDGKIIGTITGVKKQELIIPNHPSLFQNYPNPFNPSTEIRFSLPNQSHVSLKIFDLLGREIAVLANEVLEAGDHSVKWNAADAPSGIYFYRLEAGKFVETKKMILLK